MFNKSRPIYDNFSEKDISGACVELLENDVTFYTYFDDEKFINVREISSNCLNKLLKAYNHLKIEDKQLEIIFYKVKRGKLLCSWFKYKFFTVVRLTHFSFETIAQKISFYEGLKRLPCLEQVFIIDDTGSQDSQRFSIKTNSYILSTAARFLKLFGFGLIENCRASKINFQIDIWRTWSVNVFRKEFNYLVATLTRNFQTTDYKIIELPNILVESFDQGEYLKEQL